MNFIQKSLNALFNLLVMSEGKIGLSHLLEAPLSRSYREAEGLVNLLVVRAEKEKRELTRALAKRHRLKPFAAVRLTALETVMKTQAEIKKIAAAKPEAKPKTHMKTIRRRLLDLLDPVRYAANEDALYVTLAAAAKIGGMVEDGIGSGGSGYRVVAEVLANRAALDHRFPELGVMFYLKACDAFTRAREYPQAADMAVLAERLAAEHGVSIDHDRMMQGQRIKKLAGRKIGPR